MLCWERGVPFRVRASPVEQPPESGYGLCQCLASSETKIVSWKDWGASVVCPSCLSRACCCICYSPSPNRSPPVWKIPAKLSRYCESLSPHRCSISSHVFLLQLYHYKQSGADAIMSFMSMQNMGKHVGALNDPTWSDQVIRQYLVISCNHKICQGKVFLLLR